MSKVTFNQTGYIGCSMSINARDAYEAGEMPKSKWTKTAMVAALRTWCEDNDRVFDESICKMRKDEIFARMFWCSSWHHTGKFANETDFYSVNDDIAEDRFAPMTAEQIAERRAEQSARLAAAEAEREAREAREDAEREAKRAREDAENTWWAANGCHPCSIAAALIACPEKVRVWTSRKGNVCASVLTARGEEFVAPLADAYRRLAGYDFHRFDARKPETYAKFVDRTDSETTTANHSAPIIDISTRNSLFSLNLDGLWAARLDELNL